MNRLGFCCTVVTDEYCRGWFEKEGVAVESLLRDADALSVVSLLDRYRPKALVAIERCGINAQGNYANMRGESIAAHTAKMDPLFDEGRRRGILTVGIGDIAGNIRDLHASYRQALSFITRESRRNGKRGRRDAAAHPDSGRFSGRYRGNHHTGIVRILFVGNGTAFQPIPAR